MLRVFAVVVVAAALSACASSGAVYTPRPFPMPEAGTSPAPPSPSAPAAPTVPPPRGTRPEAPSGGRVPRGDGYALSGTALSFRGAPYRAGGADPGGFDCSGLVSYVYQQHGVRLPRATRDQFKVGKTVPRNRLEPGDLVFFSTVAPGASHVGIMIGGDQFVHAPSERGVVRVESLAAQYWATRFVGAKRVP